MSREAEDAAAKDRISELICSIMMVRRDAVQCLTGLLGLFSFMGRKLSVVDRIHFSRCLHEVGSSLINDIGHDDDDDDDAAVTIN